MADEPKDEPQDGDVTTQPAISTEEAQATDVELSPVGDEKADLTPPTPETETRSLEVDAVIEVRDAAKREIEVRLLPWEYPIETVSGPEVFTRGAFSETP